MKTHFVILTLALAVLVPSPCLAGPFGFNYGETKAEVTAQVGASHIKVVDAYTLDLNTAPKAHEEFGEYLLTISPTKGLVKIVAVGNDVDTGDSGSVLQEHFVDTEKALISVYGAPERQFNFLHVDSTFKEPEFWMLSLMKQERSLSTFWKAGAGEDSPNLVLTAKALHTDRGYLLLTYEFPGWDAMSAEIQKQANSSF